jgi:hypothetical protein
MGGKGSGGYRRNALPREKNPMMQAADPSNVDRAVNSRVMGFGRDVLAYGDLDVSDPQAVRDRFYDYLGLCDKWGIRPMVNSLAQALGMRRQDLWGIATGSSHYRNWHGIAPASVDVIQKAYDFLQTSWEIYLTEEKGNPVKWFFLAKNYFGYEDQTVKVTRVEGDARSLPTPEEVAAKYALQVGMPQIVASESEDA